MASLVDRFLATLHDAPVTAAAYDPWSGARASADATGRVVVARSGESSPGLTLEFGAQVSALAWVRGGALLAVGTEDGTVAVVGADDGRDRFRESREGGRGRVRAMRGLAISPEGARLASIAADGLLRTWDLQRGERLHAWQGFGGRGVDFDERGTRIVALDHGGQPRMVDLLSNQGLPMDRLQAPAETVCFSLDGTHVVAAGPSGISTLRVVDGALVHSFATRGGSGLLAVVQRPDGAQIAAVSQRSVHVFSLPDLQPVDSARHGAPEPSGASYWGQEGWRVGGSDGAFHDGADAGGVLGPANAVGGFGAWRLVAHANVLAGWKGDKRLWLRELPFPVREVHVDRDGSWVVAALAGGPLTVLEAASGRVLFDGGPETIECRDLAVGGSVVACLLRDGGVRWWDLAANTALELRWPAAMALSHGGTWLAALTPRGAIKLVDPRTGRDGLAELVVPEGVVPQRLAFVNRRPDLLSMDSDRVLTHYDLTNAGGVSGGSPWASRGGSLPQVQGRDVLQFGAVPDRLWGLTGGRHAALRIPDGDHATIMVVDLQTPGVLHAHAGLDRGVQVDVEGGRILTPARGAALLEREPDGTERRVLRALGRTEWVAYGARGILDASPGAAERLG